MKLTKRPKVTFNPIVTVRYIPIEPRKGVEWLQAARDRHRFQRRIQQTSTILNPILKKRQYSNTRAKQTVQCSRLNNQTTMRCLMLSIIILLTLPHMALSEKCGQPPICHCSEFNTVTCQGFHIRTLPTFNHSLMQSALFLDILNTSIPDLSQFKQHQWPKLEILTLYWNRLISCNDILKQNGTFYIDSTCSDYSISNYPEVKGTDNLIWMIPPLLVLYITLTIVYCFCKCVKKIDSTHPI